MIGAQWFESVEAPADGDACAVLEVSGYREGGHDAGQVGVDLVLTVEEDRPGGDVVIGHAEGAFHLVEVQVRRRRCLVPAWCPREDS